MKTSPDEFGASDEFARTRSRKDLEEFPREQPAVVPVETPAQSAALFQEAFHAVFQDSRQSRKASDFADLA